MNSIDTQPHPAPAEQPDLRKVFWAALLDWLAIASDDELHELVKVLDGQYVGEVQPLATAIRTAMRQQVILRDLPSGLVRQLKAANWPDAQATG